MPSTDPVKNAQLLGISRLQSWTQDGTLIDAAEYCSRRGIGPDDLLAAERAGEVFALWIEGQPWYPSALLQLPAQASAALCKALLPVPASARLIFLLAPHGTLRGKTPARAIEAGMHDQVVKFAEVWARDK